VPFGGLDGVSRATKIAESAFDRLDLSADISVESIKRLVESQRGRPIRIAQLDSLAHDEVCGLWLVTDDADLVLHAPSSSRLYTQQVVLHELAHMILEHDTVTPEFGWEALLPDIPLATIRRGFARSHFDNEFELSAEVLADLLAGAIRRTATNRPSFMRVFA
jgi:hypothetical protein